MRPGGNGIAAAEILLLGETSPTNARLAWSHSSSGFRPPVSPAICLFIVRSALQFRGVLVSLGGLMLSAKPDRVVHLRTLLILGRVSNLPTVWSNCLAGWLLGGGGEVARFQLLCLGATFLYLGGMYLNDAFDAGFDRQYRRERPIPAGLIGSSAVWQLGSLWLVIGMLTLAWIGRPTALLAVLLLSLIVLYDAVHKFLTFSPVLMAACRFWLYLVAGSASSGGVTGLLIWSGLALALYVVGLSYLARKESVPGPLRRWPLALLAAPIVLALLVNGEGYWHPAVWLIFLLALWVIRCLRHVVGQSEPDVQRTVSGLLAGIVWVDLLAVAGGSPTISLWFAALFALARLCQKFIPAT